jgi:hypothetical protein
MFIVPDNLFGDVAKLRGFVELVHRHEQAEYEQNLETALDTVCDVPHYTLMPFGWTLPDKATVREFYTALMPMLKRVVHGSSQRSSFYGPTGLVMYDRGLKLQTDSGATVSGDILAVVLRDPGTGLLSGEHGYISGGLVEEFRRQIGPDLDRKFKSLSRPDK